mmetsp:Transcript_26247/g.88212  ORF Transcript_26247/g.88212 Transcript_26247/m.88212 type:complete len:206 (-) Transcript_26247:319-936(-)
MIWLPRPRELTCMRPLPLRRSFWPGCAPAGTSTSTIPSSVSTFSVVPSAASHNANSHSTWTSGPSRSKYGSLSTWNWTCRSPLGAPASPAPPLPLMVICMPVSTPWGTAMRSLSFLPLRPSCKTSCHSMSLSPMPRADSMKERRSMNVRSTPRLGPRLRRWPPPPNMSKKSSRSISWPPWPPKPWWNVARFRPPKADANVSNGFS